MPLKLGSSPDIISANIAELVKAGHPQKQAAAIAYREASKHAKDMKPEEWDEFIFRMNQFLGEERDEAAHDSDFKEGDHPRAGNGQFGSGGGSTGAGGENHSEGASSVKGLNDHPLSSMRDYSPKELDWEYGTEYKKYSKSFAPNAFSSREDFHKKFDAAPLKHLTDAEYKGLTNTSGMVSIAKSDKSPEEKLKQVREIIGARRDVTRIVTDLKEGKTAPPIILKKGNTLRLMAGNTRLITAASQNINLPVKVIDVTEKKTAQDEWFCMAADSASPVGPFPTEAMATRAGELLSGKEFDGLAFDRMTISVKGEIIDFKQVMAFDKSARTYDPDGRMHLEACHISKACVSPYLGKEIPGYEQLELDADKVYQLLRDPVELQKAAPTFNGLPLLIKHTPINAADHEEKADEVVGATGTHAAFNAPYLDNALVIWPQFAIDGVIKKVQKELSCGYYYRPDMTPGKYQGVSYDGVMRDIVGNHVALVEEGRAGPDVVVSDAANPETKESTMKIKPLSRTAIRVQGALAAALIPMMATDAKLDLRPVVLKLTRKNMMAKDGKSFRADVKKALAKAAFDAAEPMMTPEAKAPGGGGASPDDVIMRVLDMVEGQVAAEPAGVPDEMPPVPEAATVPSAAPAPAAGDPAAAKKKKVMDAMIAKGMNEDDASELADMMSEDEEEEEDEPAGEDEGPEMVPKKAMDAAIKKSADETEKRVLATQRAIAEAITTVRPYVGDVSMTFDSAEAVYRHTLKALKVDGVDDAHADALKPILLAQPKPGDRKVAQDAKPTIALDAAGSADLAKRFPHAAKIGVNVH